MKRAIMILLILGGVVGASVAGYQYLTPAEPQTLSQDPSVEIVQIGRETLVDTVSATGRIEPKAEVEMRFETAGVVSEVRVERGQYVTAGAVLAQLETAQLELAVRRAEIDLAEQEAALAQLYEPASAEKIASAEAAIVKRPGSSWPRCTLVPTPMRSPRPPPNYARLKSNSKRSSGPMIRWLIMAMWVRCRRPRLQEATIDYDAALAEYNLAIEEPTEVDIAEAQSQLAQARADLAELLKKPSAAEVATKQAAIDRAKLT